MANESNKPLSANEKKELVAKRTKGFEPINYKKIPENLGEKEQKIWKKLIKFLWELGTLEVQKFTVFRVIDLLVMYDDLKTILKEEGLVISEAGTRTGGIDIKKPHPAFKMLLDTSRELDKQFAILGIDVRNRSEIIALVDNEQEIDDTDKGFFGAILKYGNKEI